MRQVIEMRAIMNSPCEFCHDIGLHPTQRKWKNK